MNNQQGCNAIPHPLLSIDEALETLIGAAKVINKTQLVALDDALDKVLAFDICSDIASPGFDNSSMDGYAIHLKEDQIAIPGGFSFEITDRISAGSTGKMLVEGCAARIFTGAPIPRGANTVVMQEECELIDGNSKIEIYRPIALNENIRPRGNDIQLGDVILSKGRQLLPQDIALAASVGVRKIEVFKRIKVGVFFTGDELVEPGNALKKGQIFNSNRYALVAMLNKLGCEIVNLGNIKDTFKATCDALEQLKSNCDLIVTTGGVSVGEEDHVKPAVEKLGKLDLWRIKVKPGKPLAFGSVADTAFIGLPGNPVSAMVTFFLFAQPFIRKMQGLSVYQNQTTQVQCNFDWQRPRPRREFVRVKLDCSTAPASASLYPKQGSDVLSSMVWADGLIEVPENSTFSQGKILNYYSL
ncbi:molybdopterin molybdotransferase MoeA [Bathymodiolus septemdierum thioautotrophic gill symbiont]|uniref:Molybdopterin molybdenumtransferase n=1 Tax=endosymbiont of Bathymodiolus septemdierum str. Myojin knoll TaxID=1303921 RepID=A0A0P0USG6_9GAMM|nr:gephyrin-like molybdotransferase Glp [Bathymodiolus septemdierum thioautotrophic gill symbiont]BAS68040.1 molybdopterin molybdotransferase [endosymbiont of Bathymodiolus septemdierum str. Myojin knoll]